MLKYTKRVHGDILKTFHAEIERGHLPKTFPPKPFPGRFPTRLIFSRGTHNEGKHFFTKPNLARVNQELAWATRNIYVPLMWWELDRAGIFAYGYTTAGRVGTLGHQLQWTDNGRAMFYHPWGRPGIEAFLTKWYHKRLGFTQDGKKIFRIVYSTEPTLKMDQVRNFKEWARVNFGL